MNPNANSFQFNPRSQGFVPPQLAAQQYAQQQQQGEQADGQQPGGQPYAPQSHDPYYGQQAYGAYPQQSGGYQQPGGRGYPQQGYGQYPQQQYPVNSAPYRPYQQGAGASSLPSRPPSNLPPPPAARAPIPGSVRPPTAAGASGEARKPVSLSIGGGAAASDEAPRKAGGVSIIKKGDEGDAPRKPVSLSIGGGAKKADDGDAPRKAVSLSIGGAKPAAAAAPPKAAAAPVSASAAEPVVAPAGAVAAVKAEAAAPADKTAASPPASVRSESPAPAAAAPAAQSVRANTAAAAAASEKATMDAAAVEEEAKKVTDEETLRDLFGDAADSMKSHLNVVFIGHVDAGKSTMGGQLLHLTGMVDKRTLEKYEREAKEAGRESWYLSWALDSTPQEREKGKTVEVGRAYFETGKRRYTILDAPGHKTYVPSMISGAAQADVALLVISARRGEFETGFERGGQTREHVMLVKTAGVQKLIIVVNKMDEATVNWEKERYDEIVNKLTPFLKGAGFGKNDVTFVPVSAYSGSNLKDPVGKTLCPWYNGPALLPFLDDLEVGDRKISAPLKMPISEKYADMGTVVVGKLEAGKLRKGEALLLMPNKTQVEVVSIHNETEEEVPAAISGDNVRIKLKGVDMEDVSVGFVLTSAKQPGSVVTQFEAQIAILDSRNIICAGYSAIMHCHTLSEEVTLKELLHYYDKKTGRKSRKPPQFAKKGMKIIALVETTAPVCIERFVDYPQLGRFTLRDEGKTIGIGKVHKLLKDGVAAAAAEGGGAALAAAAAAVAEGEPDVGKLSIVPE